jgi:tetratricopeptide (TPR) repeat protein
MKRRFLVTLVLLFAATAAFGQDKQPEMMRGAKLNEPKISTATMVIGTNEIVGSIAEPGWPIVVSAALLPEEGEAVTMPGNLQLKMTDENGNKVLLAFVAVPQPATSDEEPKYYWLASESETNGLVPGRYHVAIEPVAGFAFESGDLLVMKANPERGGLLGLLNIQRSLLLGQDDEALAEADRLTTSDAGNVDAWIAKGDILMAKDLPDEALEAYDKALEQQKATDSEPLFIQERRRAAFFRSLDKRGVIPTRPPEEPAR